MLKVDLFFLCYLGMVTDGSTGPVHLIKRARQGLLEVNSYRGHRRGR